MTNFEFSLPATLKFGVDIISRLGNIVSSLGKKALLITESILYESGTIKRISSIIEKKDCKLIILDDVTPNATTELVDYAAELSRASYVELIIGMGGIRTLSIAKAVSMLANNKGSILEYIENSRFQEKSNLPYIEIPTTPRNPFMFKNQVWLVNSKNKESVIFSIKDSSPKIVIFDPILTLSLPRRFIATTSIYTLALAIEGYLSTKSNFLSDILFLNSIKLLNENILNATQMSDDITSRTNLSLAGLFASLGLSMADPGIATSVSFVLSSKYHIHKSLSISVLLPHVMEYYITATPVKLVKIAEYLGIDISNLTTLEAALKAIEKIRRLIIELQLPSRLEEFGLKKDDLISIADSARTIEYFNYIPRSCSSEELYDLLLSSY